MNSEKMKDISDAIYDAIEKKLPKDGFTVDDAAHVIAALKINEMVFTDFLKEQGYNIAVFEGQLGECPIHGKNCPTEGEKH